MTTRPISRSWPSSGRGAPLRLRDPAGVVAAVPYLLGFAPERSLVMIGVDEVSGVGPTLRADLPTERLHDCDVEDPLPAVWSHACTLMQRNGCGRALVLLYADVDPVDLPRTSVRRLLDLLDPPAAVGRAERDRNRDDVVEVLDVLLVGPSRFRSLLCPDTTCCPAGGAPVAVTGSHPVAAAFVLAGRSPARDRDALEPPAPAPDQDDRDIAQAAAERVRTGGRAAATAARDAAMLEEWLDCLPAGPSPELAGRLAAGWRARPGLRDSCLAVFLPGGAGLGRQLLRTAATRWGSTGSPVGSAAGSTLLTGALADPGCADAVRAAAPVLRRMAALVPAPESAGVLAAHGWLSWVSGEGTAAGLLAERALAVAPEQSLALLVLRCVEHGLGAPWTGHPPGAVGAAGW